MTSELCRYISDWLVLNCVPEALQASALDPDLTIPERRTLQQASAAVAKYLDKMPARVMLDGSVPLKVQVNLKCCGGKASVGSMPVDVDGDKCTVKMLYEYLSDVLMHPVTTLSLHTQAGKRVR